MSKAQAEFGLNLEIIDLEVGEQINIERIDGFSADGSSTSPCLRGKYLVQEKYPNGFLLRKVSKGDYKIFLSKSDLLCSKYVKWSYTR